MGLMKQIQIEIDNSPALDFLKHKIQYNERKIEKIHAMLAEICHNCDNKTIEQCYIARYES